MNCFLLDYMSSLLQANTVINKQNMKWRCRRTKQKRYIILTQTVRKISCDKKSKWNNLSWNMAFLFGVEYAICACDGYHYHNYFHLFQLKPSWIFSFACSLHICYTQRTHECVHMCTHTHTHTNHNINNSHDYDTLDKGLKVRIFLLDVNVFYYSLYLKNKVLRAYQNSASV